MEWETVQAEPKLSFADLLFFPVTLPTRGFLFLLNAIKEHAERELFDEATLRRKLLELELLNEMGEVAEQDYRQTRAEIIERLREIRGDREE